MQFGVGICGVGLHGPDCGGAGREGGAEGVAVAVAEFARECEFGGSPRLGLLDVGFGLRGLAGVLAGDED